MNSDSPVNVAIMFIERINRRDWDGLAELMSPDHRLISGDVTTGREKARSALSRRIGIYSAFLEKCRF